MDTHGQEYLTVPEVARLLRVSPKTVYRLVQSDPSLPVLRLPGALRFPRDRLQRWLEGHTQGHARPRRSADHMRLVAKSAQEQTADVV